MKFEGARNINAYYQPVNLSLLDIDNGRRDVTRGRMRLRIRRAPNSIWVLIKPGKISSKYTVTLGTN